MGGNHSNVNCYKPKLERKSLILFKTPLNKSTVQQMFKHNVTIQVHQYIMIHTVSRTVEMPLHHVIQP